MAQAGYTPLSLYYSTTASAAPTAGNLINGELGLNITDGKLYYKDNLGVVQLLASKAAAAGVTTFSAGTTGLTPNSATGGAVTLAGTLNVANGGTGLTSLTAGSMVYGAGTSAYSTLAIGTNGYILQSNGTAPTWVAQSTITTGTATNLAGGIASQIPYQSAAGTTAFIANGTSGQVLTSNGTSAPSWQTPATGVTTLSFGTTGLTPNSATSGAITVAGTLATTNGGTGLTAFTSGGAVYATSTSALATGTLPVTAGGTGKTAFVANQVFYASSTSTLDQSANLTFSGAQLAITGQGYSPNLTLTDAATIAWDTNAGQVATFTFVSSNRTMGAPTNLVNGGFYALAVIQNGGGNTLTWNSVFKWVSGSVPTLSTAAGAKDYFVFRSDGTNLYQQGAALGVA